MRHDVAKTLGKQTCDVIQMLETLGAAYNHNEDDKRLQQVIAPAMKVAAHTLRPVLEALNLEEVTSPESVAAMNVALKEARDEDSNRNDEEFHSRNAQAD